MPAAIVSTPSIVVSLLSLPVGGRPPVVVGGLDSEVGPPGRVVVVTRAGTDVVLVDAWMTIVVDALTVVLVVGAEVVLVVLVGAVVVVAAAVVVVAPAVVVVAGALVVVTGTVVVLAGVVVDVVFGGPVVVVDLAGPDVVVFAACDVVVFAGLDVVVVFEGGGTSPPKRTKVNAPAIDTNNDSTSSAAHVATTNRRLCPAITARLRRRRWARRRSK